MKEKLMERFNRKLSKFRETEVTSSVLDYRYGELTGIIDTMRVSDMISKEDYISFIRLIDFIYKSKGKNIIERILGK